MGEAELVFELGFDCFASGLGGFLFSEGDFQQVGFSGVEFFTFDFRHVVSKVSGFGCSLDSFVRGFDGCKGDRDVGADLVF